MSQCFICFKTMRRRGWCYKKNRVFDMIRSELRCEKLQPSNSPSWGGSYLLDVESEDSITMLENHWLQNLGSRIIFQADRPAGDIAIQKKSESFVSGGQLNGLQTELDMNVAASDDAFYSAINADLSLEEQWFKYPAPFCIDSIDKLEDVSSMFSEKDVKDMISNPVPSTGGTPSPSVSMQENDHSSVDKNLNGECDTMKDTFTTNADRRDDVGTHSHKRLRKPPKRYIDVISEPTSNTIKKRRDACITKSNEMIPVKHHKVLAVKSSHQKSRPASFHIDSIDQLEDVSSMFSEEEDMKDMISIPVPSAGGTTLPSIAMQENDHSSVDKELNSECHTRKDNFNRNADEMDTIVTHTSKRLRKPPQRYIDEISEPTLNPTKKRGDTYIAKSSEKIPVKHHKVFAAKSRDQKSLPEDLLAKAIQVPFAPVSCCEKPLPVATKVNIKPLPVATKVNIEPLFVATKVKKGPGCHMVSKIKFKGDHATSSSSNLKINQAVGPPRGQVRNSLSKPKFKSDHSSSSSSNQKTNQAVRPPHEQVLHFSSDDKLALVTMSQDECNGVLKSGENDDRRKHHTNHKIDQPVRHLDEQVLHPSSDDRRALVTTPQDECNEVTISEENGGRRKHHILWTMSEVEILIDGVSQHGVGRWSRMKKELFPSSPHRTPVDLKDKWRNLLKAAYLQRENKTGEGKKRNLAWRPLPKSILQRVGELSVKYPYPRDIRSKH